MREYISEDVKEELTLGDERLVRKFQTIEPDPTKTSCVYGIFGKKSGELLYVGQTRALIRRISDHFRTRSGTNLLHLVEQDDDIDIEGGRDGNILERTAVSILR